MQGAMRRASFGLLFAQLAIAWHARARNCAHCLLGAGAARKLVVRARRAAPIVVGPCTTKGQCTREKPLFSGARPWCDVPVGGLFAQPIFAWHARARHCALIEGHCTDGRPLFFSARPCCVVPAVFPTRSRLSVGARERATVLAISQRGVRTRCAAWVMVGPYTTTENPEVSERRSS